VNKHYTDVRVRQRWRQMGRKEEGVFQMLFRVEGKGFMALGLRVKGLGLGLGFRV